MMSKTAFEKMGLEPTLIDEILSHGRSKRLKAGEGLQQVSKDAFEFPLVVSGVLKVMREDPSGNEVLLYFLESGDACAMSINCCLQNKMGDFKAIAEEDSELWLVPMSFMDVWIQKYRSFRKFIFSSYQLRFDELMNTIDSISFMKMDERLYKYLLDKKQVGGSFVIEKTHEQIAKDLNTSRVVISRLLKQLEKEDKIEQYRNRIEVL